MSRVRKLAKTRKLDEEGEQAKPLKSLSSDDEEANEDLSLKIVQKAILRACSTTTITQNDAVLDASPSLLNESVEAVKEVKKKKVKRKKRVEAEEVVVVDTKLERAEESESFVINKFVEAKADLSDNKEVGKAKESKSLETNKLVELKADISDNIVLRKLLRGPRYFDPPDSSWATCYNCGEEGHNAVKCTSAKRKRPCFVCGSLEHNVKQCAKGKDCFICNKGGHRAKDCPDKKFGGGPLSAKICLKCGQSGHEMFSCKNSYSSDDLKEIQCYICKRFGHLCCVNYTGTAVGEISCYRCGQSGHTGLACTRSHREPNGSGTPSSCYKCGKEGHFARECTSSSKILKKNGVLSTPKHKRWEQSEDYSEDSSLSHDFDKGQKWKKYRNEGWSNSTPTKSNHWGKTHSRKFPATPISYNDGSYGSSNSYGKARKLHLGNSVSNDSKSYHRSRFKHHRSNNGERRNYDYYY